MNSAMARPAVVPTDGLGAASALQMSKGRPAKMGIGRENGDGAYGWPRGGRNRPTTTLGWQQPVEKPTNAIKLRATDKGEEDVWWWNGSSSTVMRAAVPPKVAAVTAKR